MIKPPHAPEGVRSEFGCADDLVPGALFRFVDADEWHMVYDTRGCCCGQGPWECAHCRVEHDVLYGDAPTASFDKHGHLYGEFETITWAGLDEPPEVELILNPTEQEKADLLQPALPNHTPSQE